MSMHFAKNLSVLFLVRSVSDAGVFAETPSLPLQSETDRAPFLYETR
jgi:hypothetical protein